MTISLISLDQLRDATLKSGSPPTGGKNFGREIGIGDDVDVVGYYATSSFSGRLYVKEGGGERVE